MNTIYCFTNLINNKKYIGSTINDPNKRYSQHLYNATHSNAHQYNYPLYQAIRKYGIENFKYEILKQIDCSEQEIRNIEHEYIIKYNTLSPNGYNQTLDTNHPIGEETSYQKMSNTKREKAKKVAEIDKDYNILNIWRSIADCAENTNCSAAQIANCCRGEHHSTQGRYFCWLDDDDKLIIPKYTGSVYKGKPGTTQQQKTNRKVAKLDIQTGQILQIYESIALASRENNCDASGISKTCRGKRAYCGGFKWKYIEE